MSDYRDNLRGEWVGADTATSVPEPPPSMIDEAKAIVVTRRKSYGRPDVYFVRFAQILSALFNIEVSPEKAVAVMIAGKFARLIETPDHRDSIVDIIGYADCLDRVIEARK